MNATVPFPTAVVRTLAEALAADPSLVVLTEGEGPGTAELVAAAAERVIPLPVSDRASLAVAVGMAWGGRRVVVEVAATGRLPALAEVLAEAAAAPADFPARAVLRVPHGGDASRIDAAALDLLAGVPGLRVVCPRDAGAAAGLLRAALAADGPVVLLEPRALLRTAAPVDASPRPLGACQVVREGRHVTVAAFGAGVGEALAAADELAGEGIDAEVVDLVSLAPVDAAGLGERVRRTGRLVVAAPEGDAPWARRALQAALGEAFLHLEAPPASCAADRPAILTAARAAARY